MLRSRAIFTAPIVLAIVVAGVFFIRSRDTDNSDLNTTQSRDCPPVARADAVATKPATPISIDVLANDTDADGDPLVFQILKTTGGDATVDDGGTPTDASDDRVLFTPADPAPENATIEYQAVDPNGAVGAATATVTINAEGSLPPGAHSEAVAERAGVSEDCGGKPSTSTTEPGGTTVSSSPPFTGSLTGTTVKSGSSGGRGRGDRDRDRDRDGDGGRTTRTTRRDTSGDSSPTTTRPPNTNTTQPQPTTSRPATTTTQPPGPEPTTPPQCGPFPSNGTEEEQEEWKQCVRDAN